MNTETIKKGGFVGVVVSALFLFGIPLAEYNGRCDVSVLGGSGRDCTFFEYIFSKGDYSLGVIGLLSYFWWVVLIIILLSILGTYLYYKRKNT